ncbi:SGNH/GDSL hydrolase family protein [Lentzea sp. NPDC042327]|uniref:SGNH/GDSL hydrolase family protein n=1 Tax=Lentzea sp. NPDC042327 TaxID=3154801 RepID=UPI00340650A9
MPFTVQRPARALLLVVVVLLTQGLVPPGAAWAASGYPYSMPADLSGVWAAGVLGTVDGGAVTTCNSERAPVSAVGLAPGGTERMRISAPAQGWRALSGCSTNTAVDGQNRYFAPYVDHNTDDVVQIGGFDPTGTRLWHTPVRTSCSSYRYWTQVHSLAIGADGNLYALVYNHDCRSENVRLLSLDRTTGAVRFDRPLSANAAVSQYGYLGSFPLMSPHRTGVTVLDGSSVRHVDHDGTVRPDAAEVVRGYDTVITGFSVNAAGDAFVAVDQLDNQGSSCVRHVQRVDLDGTSRVHGLTNAVGWCTATRGMRATPDGGVVLSTYGRHTDPMITVSASGETSSAFAPVTGAVVQHVTAPQVDLDGNVYVARFLTYTGSGDEHVEVRQTDRRGRLLAVHNTGAQPTVARDTIGTPHHGEGLALTQDAVLLVTCVQPEHCNLGRMNNGPTPPLTLWRLPFKGASIDYPRGDLLGQSGRGTGPLRHVALGDSFSSGEAVKPYTAPSDANGCHRSALAYAELVDQDRTLDFTTDFRACSGATTATVQVPANGEPAQLSALGDDTRLVTLTIGGNDVKFSDFAKACVSGSCGVDSARYRESKALVDFVLPGLLDDLYAKIALRARDAEVWVLGYPQLIAGDADFTPCRYLGPLDVDIDETDQAGARTLVTALNDTIRDRVGARGTKFHYLDPAPLFEGHELCSTRDWPYFYGPQVPELGSSYHPNAAGQAAYAELVKEQAIRQHLGW